VRITNTQVKTWLSLGLAFTILVAFVYCSRGGAPRTVVLEFPVGFHGEFRIVPRAGVPSINTAMGVLVIQFPEDGTAYVSKHDFEALGHWHDQRMQYEDGNSIPQLLDTYSLPREGIYGCFYGYSARVVGSTPTSEEMSGLIHNPP